MPVKCHLFRDMINFIDERSVEVENFSNVQINGINVMHCFIAITS